MSCWAIVPIKASDACKTRLRGSLSDADRRALAARMVRHVVETAGGSVAIDRVAIVGPERHGLDPAIPLIVDGEAGLNAALAGAFAVAAARGATRIVVLPGDLPLLTVDDVDRLADAARDGIGIAPDRAGTGTNGLALAVPSAFRLAFGEASFAAHHAEAGRIGMAARIVRSPTLALDVDDAESLALSGLPSDRRRAA